MSGLYFMPLTIIVRLAVAMYNFFGVGTSNCKSPVEVLTRHSDLRE